MNIDYTDEPATVQIEAITIQELLSHYDNNKSKVAEMLETQRHVLRKRIKEAAQGKEWLVRVYRSKDDKIACLTWFNGVA